MIIHFIPKRIISALLALLILGGCFILPAQAASVGDFNDVAKADWYYDAVSAVVSKGLFTGITSSSFGPNKTMTRAMFITVLGRYAGVDDKAYLSSGKRPFADVDYDEYYAGYAIWGYEKGIVKGMSDDANAFAPNSKVTREQICSFLNRYIAYAGLSIEAGGKSAAFADAGKISSWALADVNAMQSYGIVKGEESGSSYVFRPRDNATRAQVATMFQRLLNSGGNNSSGSNQSQGTTDTNSPAMPSPADIADTPATMLDAAIAVPTDIIRVGLYIKTKDYDTCLSSVKLENTSGGSFEYGSFNSSRRFEKSGEITSSAITVTISGATLTITDSAGKTYTASAPLAIHPVSSGKTLTRVAGEDRFYGDFELRQASNKSGYITVINYVNIEDYVKGVIPYEYSPSWPLETLKAAAVTARNYAYTAGWSTYDSYGFDITSKSQVYYGRGETHAESYFSETDKAVDATAKQLLTYSSGGTNKLCTTYYHSSSGGATESSENIWGGAFSYLVGKLDPYEASAASLASNYTYSITNNRTGSKLQQLANKRGLGKIAKDGIKIETYSSTGNVKKVTITDENGKTYTYTGSDRQKFLEDFGFTAYSYRYKITYDSSADAFTCTRYGWGHNVGLSQWGAYAMAKTYGKDYRTILGFYYTGTHLQNGAY